jgi:glycosyltransferase involved in cell wall biosynthesis
MAARLPRINPQRYEVIRPPEALAHRAGHAWEQAALPAIARKAELIYSPANLAPLASRRNVVVIHDVAALRHPEWYRPAYVRYQRALLPAIAKRAKHVITVSEFSKKELTQVLNATDVSVIPNGVDERFTPDAKPSRERPYVLAVGTQIARKNLQVLNEAARRLNDHGIELVHAGSGRGYMRAETATNLRPLGYVPDDELPGLYAGALALAMPSLYEGFGLPCLEAMACGTPVVAANAGALPETCGQAATLVDPRDANGFADELERLATDRQYRGEKAAESLAHAANFSWQRSAQATDQLLGNLL